MITLALETSTPCGSVAVHDGARLLFAEGFTAARGHSALLFPLLQAALRVAPRPEQIVVGLGPGSYAGVRIAIASALGLELSLGSGLIGVPSVAALEVDPEHYVVVGDARRETFYWSEVQGGVCLEGPLLLEAAELHERLAELRLPLFTCEPMPAVPQALGAQPTALRLAHLAALGRGILQTGTLEPIYLREAHITRPKSQAGAIDVERRAF